MRTGVNKKMIDKDFEYLIWNAQEAMSVKEFNDFLKQLDKAGYNYYFLRKGSRIIVKQEKPSLIQKLKRFFSKTKKKRLKLNREQKFVFKQILKDRQRTINVKKIFYSKRQIMNNYPDWVKQALNRNYQGVD